MIEATLRSALRVTGHQSDGNDKLMISLLHAIRSRKEDTVFAVPRPSKSCVREIYAMLEPFHDYKSDEELCPDPYLLYGLFTNIYRTDWYSPDNFVRNPSSSLSVPADDERWISENEPPLSSLESYQEE